MKHILNQIKIELEPNNKIVSIFARGSLLTVDFSKKHSDIDLTVVIKKDHKLQDVINIKNKLEIISEKTHMPISSTIVDLEQLSLDKNNGIHLQGSISSSYTIQMKKAKLIFGKNYEELYGTFRHYDLCTPYFNAVRLTNRFLKQRSKKGINYSFILARECLNAEGSMALIKKDMILDFKKMIDNNNGEVLKEFLTYKNKEKLTGAELEEIYLFMKFCRNFLGSKLGECSQYFKKFSTQNG